jgi:hypothetical protein
MKAAAIVALCLSIFLFLFVVVDSHDGITNNVFLDVMFAFLFLVMSLALFGHRKQSMSVIALLDKLIERQTK